MKLSIISFTENGRRLSERIAGLLRQDAPRRQGHAWGLDVCLYTKCKACMGAEANSAVLPVEASLGEWAREQMQEQNILLFIGACGIAVRAIAPSLTDKLHDSPVLVMDEKGRYMIPILSGHVGGANRIARDLAERIGAEPVITTATDINQAFAVDVFAAKNSCSIVNKDGIVKVSAKALAGQALTISIEPGHPLAAEGKAGIGEKERKSCLPEGIRLVPYPPAGAVDIVVSSEERGFDTAILLKPKEYVIGMGCKKGKSMEELERFLTKKLGELGISAAQVFALASVSQKSGEPGLVRWCQKERVAFFTYTAEELQQVQGEFEESPFVRAQVGVGNVCERAALKACEEAEPACNLSGANGNRQGSGKLVLPKCAEHGMTIAVAKREWRVCFYGE